MFRIWGVVRKRNFTSCCLRSSPENRGGDDNHSHDHHHETNDRKFGRMKDIDDIMAGNKRWVEKTLASDPSFFKRLSAGQKPHFLYIGCSGM
jgi:hypothetical protein